MAILMLFINFKQTDSTNSVAILVNFDFMGLIRHWTGIFQNNLTCPLLTFPQQAQTNWFILRLTHCWLQCGLDPFSVLSFLHTLLFILGTKTGNHLTAQCPTARTMTASIESGTEFQTVRQMLIAMGQSVSSPCRKTLEPA